MLNGDSNENGKNKNNRSKGTIKRAAKKRAICFGTFMQNQLNNVRCCALYHSRQKNLVTLFVAKQARTSVEKRAASLFTDSFCSNVPCEQSLLRSS